MFLGSREDIAHLGYVQGVCPKCGKTGSFTVYLAKRRVMARLRQQIDYLRAE